MDAAVAIYNDGGARRYYAYVRGVRSTRTYTDPDGFLAALTEALAIEHDLNMRDLSSYLKQQYGANFSAEEVENGVVNLEGDEHLLIGVDNKRKNFGYAVIKARKPPNAFMVRLVPTLSTVGAAVEVALSSRDSILDGGRQP